jgi:hypothetical protein
MMDTLLNREALYVSKSMMEKIRNLPENPSATQILSTSFNGLRVIESDVYPFTDTDGKTIHGVMISGNSKVFITD